MRAKLFLAAHRFWWWLRQVTGDAAYENYLRHVSRRPGNSTSPGGHGCELVETAEQFYIEQLNRKFSRISRCC
ncbi:MAG TPA: CstA-like transporter-associated (seleno)protein [Candidatus Dormibacteraeota bacterium]|nr:CstA-like transporter-associated (seleno)protein [Candidatus Dormibacteraeota bacterium]